MPAISNGGDSMTIMIAFAWICIVVGAILWEVGRNDGRRADVAAKVGDKKNLAHYREQSIAEGIVGAVLFIAGLVVLAISIVKAV